MAQAISRGITKAGIGVETLNLEEDTIDDALAAVKEAKGFIIGSPTLGGHLPTQVSPQQAEFIHIAVKTAAAVGRQNIELMTGKLGAICCWCQQRQRDLQGSHLILPQ